MSDFAQQLTALLPTLIRSAGINGLTTAADVRNFESRVIEAVGALEIRARGSRIFTGQLYGQQPDPSLGLEGDLYIEMDVLDLYTYVDGVWGLLINLMPRTSAFVPVALNQYGTHPAFTTQLEWNIWLTQHGGGTTPPVNTTPAAPTVAFDPSLRMLTATHALGVGQLEYRHGSNGTVTAYAALLIDTNAHAAAEWQFRVKAATGRNASAWANSPAIGAGQTSKLYQALTTGDSLQGQGLGNSYNPDGSLTADWAGDPYAEGEFGGLTGPRTTIDLRNSLPTATWGDWRNLGKSGATVAVLIARYPTDVRPLRNAVMYPTRQILGVFAGINSLMLEGLTPQQVYDQLKQLIALAKADGFSVITATLTPVNQNGNSTVYTTVAALQAAIDTLNGLIRNNQTDLAYDGLKDLAADAQLIDPTGPLYRDGLHKTTIGNQRDAFVAKPVYEAVAQYGYLAYTPPSNTVHVYEDDNAFIFYSTPFALAANAGLDSQGGARYLDSASGFAGFTFTGTAFSLGTGRYGALMKYDVYVDDVYKATVTTTGANQAVADRYTLSGLTNGTHHVQLLGIPSYFAWVIIDRITLTGVLQAYGGGTNNPAANPVGLFYDPGFDVPAQENFASPPLNAAYWSFHANANGQPKFVAVDGDGKATFSGGTGLASCVGQQVQLTVQRFKATVDVDTWTDGTLWMITDYALAGLSGKVFRQGSTVVANWYVFEVLTTDALTNNVYLAGWDGSVGVVNGCRLEPTTDPVGNGL